MLEAAPSIMIKTDKNWDFYIFTIVLHVWTYTYKESEKSALFVQQNVI